MPYTIVLDLQGKRCVVVGAGRVAERRVLGLLAEGAQVCVVAPQATEALSRMAEDGAIEWQRGAYSPAVLEDAVLVFAATSHTEVNAAVASDGDSKNLLVCRADDAALGGFITPATIRQGDLLIAISTGGNSPTLAAVLKERLTREFGPEWSAWTELFGRLRPLLQLVGDEDERRVAVNGILGSAEIRERIGAGELNAAVELAEKRISSKG